MKTLLKLQLGTKVLIDKHIAIVSEIITLGYVLEIHSGENKTTVYISIFAKNVKLIKNNLK